MRALGKSKIRVNKVSVTSSPNIFGGITSAISALLEAADNGTSKVINSLGKGINADAQCVGSMGKDLISSTGDTLAETKHASESVIKDVEEGGADILDSVFGGIPGVLGMLAI